MLLLLRWCWIGDLRVQFQVDECWVVRGPFLGLHLTFAIRTSIELFLLCCLPPWSGFSKGKGSGGFSRKELMYIILGWKRGICAASE